MMVETMTLEDAFTAYGTPQFCKIDIEGSELKVISSLLQFLRTQECEFALDTNHLVDGSFTDKRIEELFHECGYDATTSTSGMKTTWAQPPSTQVQPLAPHKRSSGSILPRL